LLEEQARHGYDISKLIQERSAGALRFHVTSLYPLLYRLEERGLVAGRWVEKADQRRRRYYSLTQAGRKVLKAQRQSWLEFIAAIGRVTGIEHA
jgi:transcriptional regulator